MTASGSGSATRSSRPSTTPTTCAASSPTCRRRAAAASRSSTRSPSRTSPSTSWPRAGRAGGAHHRPQRARHDRRIDRAHPRLPPGAGNEAGGPGAQGMKKLRELLAPCVRIEVPMAERFLEEEEQLITLTHEQARLLHSFGRERRMVVTGPAGSGKTMLAVEQAKRLAAEGQGRALRLLQQAAPRPPAEGREGLRDQVQHLPRALRGAGEAGRGAAVGRRRRRLRLRLLQRGAAAGAGQRDREARPPVRRAVRRRGPGPPQRLARRADRHAPRPDEALVWLFMDDNQRVYENRLDVPKEFRPFDLDRQLPQHPGDPPRGDEEVRGRGRARGDRPRGPRGRAVPDRRPARCGAPDRRAPLRAGGGPAPGRRRPHLAQLRELGGRPGRLRQATSSSTSRSRSATTSASPRSAASRDSSRRS